MIQKLQCLITALKAESDPFIQHFRLKKDNALDFPYFVNQKLNVGLIGVGVGKKNIKSRINDFLKLNNHKEVQFINVGIAGGKKSKTNIGELFMINKILDDSSDKKYYPEIIIDHGLNESSITTVGTPVLDGGKKYDTLVDMESHEIFSTCSKFVPIHNISIIKLVSDHMDGQELFSKPSVVSELFKEKIDEIIHFINQFKIIDRMVTPILSEKDMWWIKDAKGKYLLTASQADQLINYAKGYRLRNHENVLPELDIQIPQTKNNQKDTFNIICEKLKT